MVDADAIRDLHRRAYDKLMEREEEVEAREAAAKKELAECAAARKAIEHDRSVVLDAWDVYARLALLPGQASLTLPTAAVIESIAVDKPAADSQPNSGGSLTVQRRARIGPQRYLILSAMREHGPWPLHLITSDTGLSEKRVREQIVSDEAAGIVSRVNAYGMTTFTLTPAGLDLLSRFESYRSARGLPLPTRVSVMQAGDDAAEEEDEEAVAPSELTASELDERPL